MRATDEHFAPAARRPGAPIGSDFAARLARELARNRRVGLRRALELVAAGCPAHRALGVAGAPEPRREAA